MIKVCGFLTKSDGEVATSSEVMSRYYQILFNVQKNNITYEIQKVKQNSSFWTYLCVNSVVWATKKHLICID